MQLLRPLNISLTTIESSYQGKEQEYQCHYPRPAEVGVLKGDIPLLSAADGAGVWAKAPAAEEGQQHDQKYKSNEKGNSEGNIAVIGLKLVPRLLVLPISDLLDDRNPTSTISYPSIPMSELTVLMYWLIPEPAES